MRSTVPTARRPTITSTGCSSGATSERRRLPALAAPRRMKYAVVTFGCRVNQADSLAIEGQFLARGAMASTPADADVVVVNTCSVTASADQAARQTIRRIVRANPAVRVIVTGCYASREPTDVQAL